MTSPTRRTALRRRYLSLGSGELTAAAVFVFLGVVVVGPRVDAGDNHVAVWSALVPLVAILFQAGSYWLLARQWVGRGSMPAPLAAVYRVLRAVDAVLLLVGLVGVIAWAPAQVPVTVVLVVLWLFGVVEYLNYFVVRLAYPLPRWFAEVRRWRRPRLVQDMTQRG